RGKGLRAPADPLQELSRPRAGRHPLPDPARGLPAQSEDGGHLRSLTGLVNPVHSLSKIRVRFAETDKFGAAYHGAYFAWFEVGRTDWLRERGMTYVDLMAADVHLPVISTQATFLRSVGYDARIEIRTTLAKVTGVRVVFDYELRA